MQVFPLRLKPDEDLRQALRAFAVAQQIEAGFVLSAIGSLKQAAIRFADQPRAEILTGKFEILSMQGTLSQHGVHLHILVANGQGQPIGGHLDNGSLIYTTAEIVLATCAGYRFLRSPDSTTGFYELEITKLSDLGG